MTSEIGKLFPLGGPVPPDLIIGRVGERTELARRLGERMSTMLVGPRRAGKTTVCEAACDVLVQRGHLLFDVEVPERADSSALLQLMVDRAARISLADEAGAIGRAVRPMIEKFLGDHGIPLDLSALGRNVGPADARAILSLPLELARTRHKPTILFLDELQRAVSYADGDEILLDLVDLYSASGDVVVLVDGSDERALDGMLRQPLHFGKLVDRQSLDPRIPLTTWPTADRALRRSRARAPRRPARAAARMERRRGLPDDGGGALHRLQRAEDELDKHRGLRPRHGARRGTATPR